MQSRSMWVTTSWGSSTARELQRPDTSIIRRQPALEGRTVVQRLADRTRATCMLRAVFGVGTVRGRSDGICYFEVTRPEELEASGLPFLCRAVSTARVTSCGSRDFRADHVDASIRCASSVAGSLESSSFERPMNRGGKSCDAQTKNSSGRFRDMNPQRPYARLPLKQGDEDMAHAL